MTGQTDSTNEPPVMVEVWRGSMVEMRHRGHAVVVNAAGEVIMSWGNPELWVYPRSAIKPVQALSLIESGAYAAFGLEPHVLALACASHHGEARQIRMLTQWLGQIGCRSTDLECGPQPPMDPEAAAELMRSGHSATALHNNCSGKHAAILTIARHLSVPIKGYCHPDHPVQRLILRTVAELTDTNPAQMVLGIDGCGVPTAALPLRSLATAMARFAAPTGLDRARVNAIAMIREAWGRHARLVGGSTSFDTHLIQAAPGLILTKGGADGIIVAMLPRQRLGVALKIEDGASRARDVALMALLRHLHLFDVGRWQGLQDLATPAVTNWAGKVVGQVRQARDWPTETE